MLLGFLGWSPSRGCHGHTVTVLMLMRSKLKLTVSGSQCPKSSDRGPDDDDNDESSDGEEVEIQLEAEEQEQDDESDYDDDDDDSSDASDAAVEFLKTRHQRPGSSSDAPSGEQKQAALSRGASAGSIAMAAKLDQLSAEHAQLSRELSTK